MKENFVFIRGEAVNLGRVERIEPFAQLHDVRPMAGSVYFATIRVFFSGQKEPKSYLIQSNDFQGHLMNESTAYNVAETFLRKILS